MSSKRIRLLTYTNVSPAVYDGDMDSARYVVYGTEDKLWKMLEREI
jgi:hypothetical protein